MTIPDTAGNGSARLLQQAKVMKVNLSLRIVGAMACLTVAGCGTVTTAGPPQTPPPDTKAVVLGYLRGEPSHNDQEDVAGGPGHLFNAPQQLGLVELSPARQVEHSLLGWAWLACMRTHPSETRTRDYALFIKNGQIGDARLSVATDRCATQTYEPLGRFVKKQPEPDKDKEEDKAPEKEKEKPQEKDKDAYPSSDN